MSADMEPGAVTDAWLRSSEYLFDSVLAANRAAFAAFGVGLSGEANGRDESEEDVGSMAGVTLPEWDVTLSATERDAIEVGDYIHFEKTLSDADVRSFALTSGDTNPLHLDDEFATTTRFGGRIAHGTLVSGLISAALARLPGLVIYLSQDLEFRAPVGIGNRVAAECEVVESLGGYRYRLSTTVIDLDSDDVVIDGEAVVLLDEGPHDE